MCLQVFTCLKSARSGHCQMPTARSQKLAKAYCVRTRPTCESNTHRGHPISQLASKASGKFIEQLEVRQCQIRYEFFERCGRILASQRVVPGTSGRCT
jgi:hypothetical protein